MQGYLKELSWQEELFARAHRLAEGRKHPKVEVPRPTSDMFDPEPQEGAFEGPGAAWVVAANPFIQIELTDLGSVEAAGIWTRQVLPENARVITEPFLRVLESLDAPNPIT
jgi:hypothetical protein